VKTDRATALDLAQFGIESAAVSIIPEAKAAEGVVPILLGAAKRIGIASAVGGALEPVKEYARRLMGYAPNPNLSRDIVVHAGFMGLFQGLGEVMTVAPKVFRAIKMDSASPAELISLTGKARDKAVIEDRLRFLQEIGLPTSTGRIGGHKIVGGVEKFGESSMIAGGLKNVDDAILGELSNAQNRILSNFAKMGGRAEGGAGFQALMEEIDKGVDGVYAGGKAAIIQITKNAPIVDPGEAARAGIDELETTLKSLEKKGYSGTVERSARRQRMESDYAIKQEETGILDAYGKMMTKEKKGEPVTVEEALDLTSHLLKVQRILKRSDVETPQDIGPVVQKLITAWKGSTRQALEKYPDAQEILDRINDVYGSWHEKFSRGTIAKMMNADPHKVMELIAPENTPAMREVYEATHMPMVGDAEEQAEKWGAARRLWWQSQLKGAKEATGDESGQALARRVVGWSDEIKGDASPMMKEFFSDTEGTILRKNTEKLADALKVAGIVGAKTGTPSFHYWWIATRTVSTTAGAVLGAAHGGYVGGVEGSVAAFMGTEALSTGMAAILHSKVATEMFVKGLAEAMPTVGKALSYVKPSALANIMRAVKTGMEEMNVADLEKMMGGGNPQQDEEAK
jgi:hypothetical protein